MKQIQPLQLKNQPNNSQDKQNCSISSPPQQQNQNNHHPLKQKQKNTNHTTRNILTIHKDNQAYKRFKTTYQNNSILYDNNNTNHGQQFIKTFYNTSQQFIKTHKPFLQNKRIIFNIKGRNRSNFLYKDLKNLQLDINSHDINGNMELELGQFDLKNNRKVLKQSNIQKLKKQIIQLDKEDFVSYRSKGFSQADQIKIVENQKINKYNYQNSMIVQWKGKFYQKPYVARPSSTIGIANFVCTPTSGGFIGTASHSSMAKKYFSKPKTRRNYTQSNTTQVSGSNMNIQMKQNKLKNKMKTQQIAIGLNMFRGKLHKKKVNSSFQIHY